MPTDTSNGTRGEGTDEHAETEPGTTLDPSTTSRALVAPGQPGQPLQLYHHSTVDKGLSGTAPSDCLSPERQVTLYRTERTLLETRIEALERTVEYREAQLDSVIERYETIIAEKREYSDTDSTAEFDRDSATEPFGDRSGPVRGIVDQLPTERVTDRVRSAVRSVFGR